MKASICGFALAAGILMATALGGYGQSSGRPGARPASQPAEVTIRGNVLSSFHTGEKDKSVFIYAFEGTPEIRGEVEKIMADYYPDKGLDADAAIQLQDQFAQRLEYFVTGPQVDALYKKVQWGSQMLALTGVVEEKDGKKWINVSRFADGPFKFPAKMTAPDKALVTPDKPPLLLKVSDSLALKCILLPAGKFLMGAPYYQQPRWQEDPPHLVTLTRAFYFAEHPVTQEEYEAVMGKNPSVVKDPKLPVSNVSCVDMYQFCRALSQKTGRKVRIPTAAEWEYAARVGTSNPTFKEKYAAQDSNANGKYMSPPLPVKSRQPNAWGIYDMHSGWWERVSDGTGEDCFDHKAVVDPVHIPPVDRGIGDPKAKHGHMGKGLWGYPISEIEFISSEAGEVRFRVVVEASDPGAATRPADP